LGGTRGGTQVCPPQPWREIDAYVHECTQYKLNTAGGQGFTTGLLHKNRVCE